MEHAQRDSSLEAVAIQDSSLNPYFNGTCSKSVFFVRPYALICYVAIFTLINAFVSEKCTCFLFKTLQR